MAGWAETNHECYYTPSIIINFGNPSDMCATIEGKFQNCFKIYLPGDYYQSKKFDKIGTLSEINIPESNDQKFILGKSYIDDDWLIYSIEKDKTVFKDHDYNKVLAEWQKLGNKDPKLANTNNFFKYFSETEESKMNNEDSFGEFMGKMILSFFVIIILLFFIIIILERKRKKSR